MSKRKLGDEDGVTNKAIKDSLVAEDATESPNELPLIDKAMSIGETKSEDFDDLEEKDELKMRDRLLEEFEESSVSMNENVKKGHNMNMFKIIKCKF